MTLGETTQSSREYVLHIEDAETELDFDMTVKISVENNDVTWQVTDIKKADGCAKIATIDVPNLNLLTVDSIETGANFAGALASTTTTSNADVYINFNDGFIPADSTPKHPGQAAVHSKTQKAIPGHDDMIHQFHIYAAHGLEHPLGGHHIVGRGRHGSAGMVMGKRHTGSLGQQSHLHQLAQVKMGFGQRASL